MYKVITAIGNQSINNEIKSTNKYNVIFSDIPYQEAVLEVLKENTADKMIVYEEINGENDIYDFIEKINEISEKIDIVIIVENKENNKIKRLRNLGIQKIVDIENISLDLLCNLLDEEFNTNKEVDRFIEFKKTKEDREQIVCNNDIAYNYKIITIYGNPGAGKTTMAVNLAVEIAQTTRKKVLLIDMDTLTASINIFLDTKEKNEIDIYLDEDKKCGINYCVELIQKRIFSMELFKKTILQYQTEKKLFILTGNTSIFACQNILREEYYKEILDMAINVFDYIVIDVNSNIFLDATKHAIRTANIIYYVTEATLKDANTYNKNKKLFSNVWNVNTENIKIIFNKISPTTFGDAQSFFSCPEIAQKFEYDPIYIKKLNDGKPIVLEERNIEEKFKEIIGIKKTKNNLTQFRKYIKEVFTYVN